KSGKTFKITISRIRKVHAKYDLRSKTSHLFPSRLVVVVDGGRGARRCVHLRCAASRRRRHHATHAGAARRPDRDPSRARQRHRGAGSRPGPANATVSRVVAMALPTQKFEAYGTINGQEQRITDRVSWSSDRSIVAKID